MSQPKILSIVGARPQFIKSATVSKSLKQHFREVVLHTGQHFDSRMSDIFFEDLGLAAPNYNLNIQASTHGEMTGRMLIKIEEILQKEKPDAVLVYGDTNSTLAGALAAAKLHIPIAHVEAGVRSFNTHMPEEINRVVTDRLSTWHFIPSQEARNNLLKEGINDSSIFDVGDVMLDIFLNQQQYAKTIHFQPSQPFLLITLHREENFASQERIDSLISILADLQKDFQLIWPIHPRVRNKELPLNPSLLNTMREPLSYHEILYALTHCYGVITDSGGLQKEAYYAAKPCVTLRTETEWCELVKVGWNQVVSPLDSQATEKIITFIHQDFSAKVHPNLYGQGDAAPKIAEILEQVIGNL
jgi:UDP-GlcNAc3NAcA epimerase